MFGILQRFNQQGVVQQTPAAPATPQDPMALPDDEYISGRQVKQYIDQVARQSIAPQLADLARLSASGSIAFVRQQHAEDFKRWGPEIEGYIANLPPQQRDLDNLERVVKFVRSEHLPELLADQERTLRQQFQTEMVQPGLRSSGAPGAGPVPLTTEYSLANDKLPTEWRERALRAGITERQIDDFCTANGLTREVFFKDYLLAGQVSTDKAVARG